LRRRFQIRKGNTIEEHRTTLSLVLVQRREGRHHREKLRVVSAVTRRRARKRDRTIGDDDHDRLEQSLDIVVTTTNGDALTRRAKPR
jgi:hypothetical protein